MHTTRRRVSIVLLESPGSEMWYVVKHGRGWFRLPSWASIDELFEGARDGWVTRQHAREWGRRRHSVPADEYEAFRAWKNASGR